MRFSGLSPSQKAKAAEQRKLHSHQSAHQLGGYSGAAATIHSIKAPGGGENSAADLRGVLAQLGLLLGGFRWRCAHFALDSGDELAKLIVALGDALSDGAPGLLTLP